ncbi:hypothetical protein ACFQE1_16605, partial [Halobium palmae]
MAFRRGTAPGAGTRIRVPGPGCGFPSSGADPVTSIPPPSEPPAMNHERSRDLYDRALSVLPGGVNSLTRKAEG